MLRDAGDQQHCNCHHFQDRQFTYLFANNFSEEIWTPGETAKPNSLEHVLGNSICCCDTAA